MENVFTNEDSREVLKRMPDNSIQLFLEDMPYNTTNNGYEYEVDVDEYWKLRKRVMKPNAVFALFGVNPFSAKLITSNPKWYKYDYAWIKSHKTNFLNCKKMPLREKEDILIFYKEQPIYNPQLQHKDPRDIRPKRRNIGQSGPGAYGSYEISGDHRTIPEDMAYPSQAIYVPNESKTNVWHPSQKPLRLLGFLIRTYTNEGDWVFDGYGGSGSTALASIKENRIFTVCEKIKEHFEESEPRVLSAASEPTLFQQPPAKKPQPIQLEITT